MRSPSVVRRNHGQHQKRVFRVILLLVKDGMQPNTLTQECFLRAYQSLPQFRGMRNRDLAHTASP